MDNFTLNPANYQMKGNPPKPLVAANATPDIDLTRLDSMTIDELKALIRRSSGAVMPMTDDELRAMAKDKLSALLQSIDAKQSPSLLLSVAREVLDRLEGKPTQRIEQKVEHSSKGNAGEMTNEQLLSLLRKASDAGKLPNGTKLLDDGTVITDAEYQ